MEFHSWLIENQCVLPQTFSEHHTGPHATWHPKGTEARIDFLAIDTVLRHPELRTWVSNDIDLALQRTDHLCVMMDLPITLCVSDPSQTVPKASANISQKDTVTTLSWQCNVHDHASELQKSIKTRFQAQTQQCPRKSHLSESTWAAIRWKRYCWKRSRQIKATVRTAMLRAVFNAWRSPCDDNQCHQLWTKLADHTMAWYMYQLQQWSPKVRSQVRDDDARYYTGLAEKTSMACADEGMKGLWAAIKPLLPKQRAKRMSNIRCRGPTSTEIRDHFNELEAGVVSSYDDLLKACQTHQKAAAQDAPIVVDVKHLPSRVEMEQRILRQQLHRAPGLDRISGQALRQAMWENSADIYSLVLKAWVLGAEPLQFKGGLLHCISKKAGGSRAQDMRGIMILDGIGKAFHGLIRQRLLQWSSPRRMPTQFGGYQRQQTLFATQLLRAFVRTAEHQNISTTILFLDVRSAFHCMLREHVFGNDGSLPERVKQCLSNSGLDPHAINELTTQYAADFVHTADPCLQRITQDAHSHTWYTLAHHDLCYKTHRGSRPGSPLADLAYNTMMQPLLEEIQNVMMCDEVHHSACANLGLASAPIAWVDDVAIPIVDMNASKLDDTTIRILQKVDTIFQQHGLSLNYAAGKTEAVMQYRGSAAPAMRERRFVEHLGRLQLGADKFLRTVAEYQYLGTSFSQVVSIGHELKVRLAKAGAAYRLLRKQLFMNRRLPVATRLLLLESLVVSILLHGAGNWPLLTVRQHDRIHAAIMKWARSIIGHGFWMSDRVTDTEIQARWKIPPLAVRLAKMRLLFAFKWYSFAPAISHQACTAEDYNDKSWFAAIRQGVQWLATMCQDQCDQVPITTEDVMAWLHAHHQRGAKKVRNATHRYLLQQKLVFDVLAGHRRIWDVCSRAGRTLHRGTIEQEDDAMGCYSCPRCPKVFSTAQALQGHLWSWHHQCSDERLYVFTDTCPICQTCYWTPQRMQQHLKSTRGTPNGCMEQMIRYYEPLSEPIQFDKPPTLVNYHRLPRCRVPGPVNQPIAPLWRRRQLQRLNEYDERWQATGYPTEICPDYVEEQRTKFDNQLEDWYQSGALDRENLLRQWRSHIESQSTKTAVMAFLYWGKNFMHDVIDEWDSPQAIEDVIQSFDDIARPTAIWQIWCEREAVLNWREPSVPDLSMPTAKKTAAARGSKENIQNSLLDQTRILAPFDRAWATPHDHRRPVPIFQMKDGTRYLVILHLFSGRRRPGDCGHWAAEFERRYCAHHGLKIMMLAIDTAIDDQLGNLAPGRSLTAMLELAECGVFALGLGGPPCETWSSARHLRLESNHGGPRPFRSSEMPWGVQFLTARELHQVATGSQLMMTELELEVAIVMHGGDTMMEHPEEPTNQDFASVWRIGLHRHLLPSLAPMVSHHVQQWKHGACAVKPTRIRTLGMARSYHIFQANETPGVQKPESHLGGIDSSGKFKTAAAKEYPGDFCRALIDVALTNVMRRYVQYGSKIVQEAQLGTDSCAWLHRMWAASTVIDPTVEWKPDYQPQR